METIFPVISHTVTPSLTILQSLLYCRKPSTPCTKLVQIYFCKGWRYSYLSTHSVKPRKSIQISQISWARFFFPFIFISWRLITLQYCSGFCHTLTWISHGFTCIPHPNPPSHSLSTWSLWVFPVHQPQALVSCIQSGLVICFTLDNIHVLMLFHEPDISMFSSYNKRSPGSLSTDLFYKSLLN